MTPIEHCPDLAKVLGLTDLYLKREDLHQYGSHKGRSIPAMIDHYYENGDRRFVISSSGNAALATALYISEINKIKKETAELNIYVGQNVAPNKLEKIRRICNDSEGKIQITVRERPLQAVSQAINEGWRSLRQSTDDIALIGYESLGQEIAEGKSQTKNNSVSPIKKVGAVFIGTSSGTTAQALAEYFLDKKLPIQVHIVQTSSCHPISDDFENYDGPDEKSIADAIIGISTPRKSKLVPLINKTGGYSWTASNEEIRTALEIVKKNTGLDISNNSALSIVGVMQAVYRGWEIKGAVVCLICGE